MKGACVWECVRVRVGGGACLLTPWPRGTRGEKLPYDQTSIVVGSSSRELTDRIYFPPWSPGFWSPFPFPPGTWGWGILVGWFLVWEELAGGIWLGLGGGSTFRVPSSSSSSFAKSQGPRGVRPSLLLPLGKEAEQSRPQLPGAKLPAA